MKLDILQLGAPELTKPSKEVSNFSSPEFQKLIDDMLDTVKVPENGAAGLAAPQIGKNTQLCIVGRVKTIVDPNTGEKKKVTDWKPLINPRIVKYDESKESQIWEACLSIGVGEGQLWGPVWRPDNVTIEYEDRNGKTQTTKGNGFYSHLLQHEIDHLQGILFITRVRKPDENLWKSSELDKYIAANNSYPEER